MPSPIRLHDFLLLPWELSRSALVSDMEGLHESVRKLQSAIFGSASSTEPVQLHSTTAAAEHNFLLGAATTTLVVSTTSAVFTGFAGVSDGRELLLVYKGSGTLRVAHQSNSSLINYRVICPSTNGITVGPNGAIRLVYDAAVGQWRAFTQSAGTPITPTYNAANFSAGGSQTWTVGSGDVTTYSYQQVNKLLTVFFSLESTTVGGTPDPSLYIAVPNSYVATKLIVNPCLLIDNGTRTTGYAAVFASGTSIQIVRTDIANFAAATNNTHVYGQITFEVN